MAQKLLIGLGGTGSRVVNYVVNQLYDHGKRINAEDVYCAVLDTDANDMAAIRDSGTGLAAICTGGTDTIGTYKNRYSHLNPEKWCSDAKSFAAQTLSNGASEIRMKSRIGFMNCVESGNIRGLEELINQMLANDSNDEQIRIMIVSSLSGGSGSGMFIQVALWLRKYLAGRDIEIRGMFLLPDIFVNHSSNVAARKTAHYANAYAAIRELNTISKIRMGKLNPSDLPEDIEIQGLFDSQEDYDRGPAVYDMVFFIDDMDKNGVSLQTIPDYEKMVANMVYSQMYDPIKAQMYSQENNLTTDRTRADDPLYGSCGTAKAVYPYRSIVDYCALRATEDSLTDGWLTIDEEIDALLKEQRENERNGIYSEPIDKRAEYVKLFDSLIPKEDDVLKTKIDFFFNSLSKDTKVKIDGSDSNKENDFLTQLNDCRIVNAADEIVDDRLDGIIRPIIKRASSFKKEEHSIEQLRNLSDDQKKQFQKAIKDLPIKEKKNQIVEEVFTLNMGRINPANVDELTIFGLMTKPVKNSNDKREFIHPVAARYVLYKLLAKLQEELESKQALEKDPNKDGSFDKANAWTGAMDNPHTPKKEEASPEEYFGGGKSLFVSTEKFTNDFEKKYIGFIENKIKDAKAYARTLLTIAVYEGIIARLEGLIKKLEFFFEELDDAKSTIKSAIDSNKAETDGAQGKVIYICGSPVDKEAMYGSLNLSAEVGSQEINASIITTVYGNFCAEERPAFTANAEYKDRNITDAFAKGTHKSFKENIENTPENMAKVDLNIWDAICRVSDVAAGENARGDANDRHKKAFENIASRLKYLAAPSLTYVDETPNSAGSTITDDKVFWGVDLDVADIKYKGEDKVGAMLEGLDSSRIPAGAYSKNELCCVHTVYGLAADYIPKFNEVGDGAYYKEYCNRISEMLGKVKRGDAESAYILTPHLDKTWHKYLPYITKAMRDKLDHDFYCGLWLSLAYGRLAADKDGFACLRNSLGFIDEEHRLTCEGRDVKFSNVTALLNALKGDPDYSKVIIPSVVEKFEAEKRNLDDYVSTEVLRAFTQPSSEIHPIRVMSRYYSAIGMDINVINLMIGAIEGIAEELVESMGLRRDKNSADIAKYSILKKIYDAGDGIESRDNIVKDWLKNFEKYRIK